MTIDNSKLETFCKCPRAYYFKAICKRESNTFRAGLEFGSIIHKCLDIHYRGIGDIKALQTKTLEDFYVTARFAPDDYRNLNYATELINLYTTKYQYEPFTITSPAESNIEFGFSIPIGPDGDLWSGRVDLSVTYPDDRLWTLDHKTSSIGGSTFFNEYLNNTPQPGYVWAAQKLTGRPHSGFIINAIFNRAPSKTGKGITFERQMFNLEQDPTWAEVWEENTVQIIRQIKSAELNGFYPQFRNSCMGRYGSCEYLEVCQQPKQSQMAVLNSNLYKDVTWDPTKVE